MMNKRLPDKNEWENIVSDAFSSGDIHVFSESYERRKAGMQKGIVMKHSDERKRIHEDSSSDSNSRRIFAVTAAALVLITAVPVTAYVLQNNGSSSQHYAAEISEEPTEPEQEIFTEPTTAPVPYTEYKVISDDVVIEEGTAVSAEIDDNAPDSVKDDSIYTEDYLNYISTHYTSDGIFYEGEPFGNIIPLGTAGSWDNSYYNENNPKITASVDSVRIQDSFDGITTDGIARPYDYSAFTDSNGKILPNERTWVKYDYNDDGTINNQTVSKDLIPKKVLVAEMTYTNVSGETEEVRVCPRLFVEDEGRIYFLGDNMKKEGVNWYEDSVDFNCAQYGHFSFSSDNQTDINYILLGAGESAKVQVAFLINEYDVGHIYLDILPGFESNAKKLLENAPVVDLTDLK